MDQAGIVVPVKRARGSWLRVDGTIRARIAAVGSRILSFEFRKLEGLPDIARARTSGYRSCRWWGDIVPMIIGGA